MSSPWELLAQGISDTVNIGVNYAMAKYQNDYNYGMWKESNAYNSAAAQMERLKAAGLNPNLVYGNGAVVGNSSSPVPRSADIRSPQFNILAALTAAKDIQLKNAEIANKAAENANIKAQTGYIASQTRQSDAVRRRIDIEIADLSRELALRQASGYSKDDPPSAKIAQRYVNLISRFLEPFRESWRGVGSLLYDKQNEPEIFPKRGEQIFRRGEFFGRQLYSDLKTFFNRSKKGDLFRYKRR
jgi:hypothetical protein